MTMVINWLLSNVGTALELLLVIGGWLILVGKFQERIANLEKDMTKDVVELRGVINGHIEKFDDHLQESSPHAICMVESARQTDMASSITELRRAVSRVEGWVIALASKAGIKEPKNGD